MTTLKKISATSLLAGTLLLVGTAQAEMINLTATPQPDGTISSNSSCATDPTVNCVDPVLNPFYPSGGASFAAGNAAPGVTFFVDQIQPSGTGVLDPFLRIQNKDDEQGYNTSGRPLNFDTKNPLNYTHDLAMNALEEVNGSYSFVLDIGENNSGPGAKKPDDSLLSLDGLKLYAANFNTDPTTGEVLSPIGVDSIDGNWVPTDSEFADIELLWDMDATNNNAVLLDANRLDADGNPNPPGNGVSDMRMEVSKDIITPEIRGTYDYLILWSRFGVIAAPKGANSFATFEEWAARVCEDCGVGPPLFVPSPAPLALIGLGLGILGWKTRKSRT